MSDAASEDLAIEGYEILAPISRGGMGEVVLARRRGAHGFEKLVAIKTIRASFGQRDQARTMFLDEARLMAKLSHPTLSQVHDFGEVDGMLYLVMEYVAGLSFSRVNKVLGGPWPPGAAARAMSEACRGLHAAHTMKDLSGEPLGIVHRDISPQNLILAFEGTVRVIDFGIAISSARQSPVTQAGVRKGKPTYMSPEQWASQAVDARSDVFSMGAVLYLLLTGQPVFEQDVLDQQRRENSTAPVDAPSVVRADIPGELDAIVLRAMERDPDQRFQTAKRMAVALETVAPKLPGYDLEGFIEVTLADQQDEHRRMLRRLVEDDPQAEIETERITMPRGKPIAAHAWYDHTLESRLSELVTVGPPPKPAPIRANRVLVAAGSLGVAALALAAVILWPADDPAPRVPAPAPTEAHAAARPAPPVPPSAPAPEAVEGVESADAPVAAGGTKEPAADRRSSGRKAGPSIMAVEAAMSARGLLAGDDADLDRLLAQARGAQSRGDRDAARSVARRAQARVAAVRIDKAFVSRKLDRFNRAYDRTKDDATRRQLDPLVEQAMHHHFGGDYARVNAQLNRAFAMLRRSNHKP